MAVDMLDWSPDFCLSCDRQSTSGGAYCSQSCRLADLERASSSSSSSSLHTPSLQTSTSPWPAASNPGNGFYLPPALNFSAIAGRQSSSASSTPLTRSPLSTTPPASTYQPSSSYYAPSYSQNSRHSLYSSPSRSSLSSLGSSSQQQQQQQQETVHLSEKAKSELHDYANSFDQTRSYKRRFTVI